MAIDIKRQIQDSPGGTKMDIDKIDYSALDHPEVLRFLFYPRKEQRALQSGTGQTEFLIPVGEEVVIGAKLHHAKNSAPTILFFHGNGEVVSDYDDIGSVYAEMNINFLPVDYRGYGVSTGQPTVTGMMRDAHRIFLYIKKRLADKGYRGPLLVMGRSLGSASALELAENYQDEFDGLIIESGFAYAKPLLQLLGTNRGMLDNSENKGLKNIDKITKWEKPVLIIHAEYDHIIPFSDGQALHDACRSSEKTFLKIPGADHNTIFYRGARVYLQAISDLMAHVASPGA